MVLNYYNLKDQPFGVTPDPRYLYSSASHREALASLSYGIRSRRGFMSLIAKPGMGKTTILFQLLSQLEGSARSVFLFQTLCTPKELLRDLLRDLGVADDGSDSGRMQEQLNRVLTAEARQGRRVVVVIDEAQNLEDSALELLRMLSNFETTSYKLMQIILAGQPQLREKLLSPGLLQLRQRMSIFARLHPFNVEDTRLYIEHRLRVAGYNFKTPLFTPQAAALIARYSEGIPRNINNICFNAISLGCVLKQKSIREEVVRECLADMEFEMEAVSNPDGDRAERKVVGFNAGTITPSGSPFEWLRRISLFMIVLVLCFTSSGLGPVPDSSHHVSAKNESSEMGVRRLTLRLQPDREAPVFPGARGESKSSMEASPSISENNASVGPPAVSSTSGQRSRPDSQTNIEQANDPAKLWLQVKNSNSDAEIELARLYLDGVAVPRNCAQAQVLLQAASRKGNTRAANLLSDSASQCR